jgi:hypothetical protein
MTGLLPSQRYYYRFGSKTSGYSQTFTFVSSPITGPTVGVRFAAFGGKFFLPPKKFPPHTWKNISMAPQILTKRYGKRRDRC